MATRGDAAQAAQLTARVAVSTVVKGIAGGVITVGSKTPIVAPLCAALLEAKVVVDGASRNKEELEEVSARCDILTVHVITKFKASETSKIDVAPLEECVEKLKKVAKRYHDQGRVSRMVNFRKDGDDIRKLQKQIEAVVPIMGLTGVCNIAEGVTNIEDRLKDVQEMVARLQPRPKLAPVPSGVPVGQSWHAVRDGVVDRVCDILGRDGGPAVAALTGRSGAGKTTAAASMVGERVGPLRPLAHENEDQARNRLGRLRARFSDGVVWLRVGKGAGAADRLPRLMHNLANALHKEVMKIRVEAPAVGETGESYVKRVVEQESLRCLVVADDVWEEEVVKKLRETGMWVLLTTRTALMVQPKERVVVDKLEAAEAENVLRGAADLPPGQRLCDDAMKVLEICGLVAMDIAFVGRWGSVRTTDGVHKSNRAWARAVGEIEALGGGVDVNRDVNRLAILRAGFRYLGTEDPLAQELYVALAVFPDGHAFEATDAAVLLDHEEVAMGPVPVLERWAVLRKDASEKYRMHDAHLEFAREKLRERGDIRKAAVRSWTSHISRLDFAVNVDMYTLVNMWWTLENVGGDGWWASRPYDHQLIQMDASHPSKVLAVYVVAELFRHDRKFGEAVSIMKMVLEQCDNHGRYRPEVQMAALYNTREHLLWQGRYQEARDVDRRLGEVAGPALQLQLPSGGTDVLRLSMTCSIYGVCAKAAGHLKDAEEWFRKALRAQEGGGRTGSYAISWAMLELGQCVLQAGRPVEAEAWFKQALEIQEAKLGPDDDMYVALLLTELGSCVRETGRLGEAEALFRRALEIQEAKLGAGDVSVAYTLHDMGQCALETGRRGEAEALFRRALEIFEARLGADDTQVAVTLNDIGGCAREAGRPGEAEALLKRALEIKEAKLGGGDVSVAYTLHEMGWCALETGRSGEAEALFRRALEIKEAKLGAGDVNVAYTLHDMGRCTLEAGRPGEAEALFSRALNIFEAKLGAGDVNVAYTLHEIGRCALEAGRPVETEASFLRALEIFEVKLGRDDMQVAVTLGNLGRCARQAGRSGEAEALLERALEIFETNLGADHVDVAEIRLALDRRAEDASGPADTT